MKVKLAASLPQEGEHYQALLELGADCLSGDLAEEEEEEDHLVVCFLMVIGMEEGGMGDLELPGFLEGVGDCDWEA